MQPTLTVREQIAANVRAEAARRSTSQGELAEVLGVTRVAVNRKFRGSRAFSIEDLVMLADHWDITLSTLLPDALRDGASAA